MLPVNNGNDITATALYINIKEKEKRRGIL